MYVYNYFCCCCCYYYYLIIIVVIIIIIIYNLIIVDIVINVFRLQVSQSSQVPRHDSQTLCQSKGEYYFERPRTVANNKFFLNSERRKFFFI